MIVESTSEVVVTWSTFSKCDSIVEYGINGYILIAKGTVEKFIDGGPANHTQYIHRVRLSGLRAEQKYGRFKSFFSCDPRSKILQCLNFFCIVYHCGSDKGWSPEFWFRTLRGDENWSPRLAIYGDLGNENAQSLARLQQETQRGLYDAILHVGDFAYDMNTNNAHVGDAFMNQIESVAAYLPYMVSPGNHEEKYNFSNYRARFSMPGGTENLWYSFDLGPVHFISISTEAYYFINYGIKTLIKQYEWLKEDLKKATMPWNREKRPWIIVYGHRPMYCNDLDGDDCTHNETLIRVGLPFLHFFGLEDLFYKNNVDVLIWAHEHT